MAAMPHETLTIFLALIMACKEREEAAVRQLLAIAAEELETRTAKAVVRRLNQALPEGDRGWFERRIVMKVGAPT